jgi:mannose-6-phosphate isomerase-like protein (cupin superfamily)
MTGAKSNRVRQLVRWSSCTVLALVATAVGLIAADSMHSRTCQAGDLRGQVIQWEGERLQIVQTGQETNGQMLSMDTVREPFKDPDFRLRREDGHVHPLQEERFEIIAGSARFLIGDREVVLRAGQTAVVPPNTVHHWMALDGEPVRVKAEYRPALETGELFHRVYGPLERGEINLLHAMVIQTEYEGAVWPASPSPLIWKIMAKILAPIGRLLGYKAC